MRNLNGKFAIIIALSMATLGATVIPMAHAVHNSVGHSDKETVGECYRSLENKVVCQADKDDWKQHREDNIGPANGGAADGDPANDVAGPAEPQDPS